MKIRYPGQDGTIQSFGADFAEFVYNKFRPGSYFHWQDIEFPGFARLRPRTQADYTRVLLAWMHEQAPDHIRKTGQQWKV